MDQNDGKLEHVVDPARAMATPTASTDEKKRKKQEGKSLLESLICNKDPSSSSVSLLPAIEEEEESPPSAVVSRLSAVAEEGSKGKSKGFSKGFSDTDDKIIWVKREFADMREPNCDG
ncbi:MAG: hypothetical protein ACKPKO_64845, partial [Candidatus Fonsibacter sp.]